MRSMDEDPNLLDVDDYLDYYEYFIQLKVKR